MYALGRSLHGLLWGRHVLLGLGVFKGSSYWNAAAHPWDDHTGKSKVFSQQWVEEYSGDNLGCEMGRGSYTWRGCGFGSNMNREDV